MASCDHLFADAQDIIRELIRKNDELEGERCMLYKAVLVIQRVWRGHVARKNLRHLHDAATIIQRWVRGFLVRVNMPDIIIDIILERHKMSYDTAATKIQALWRGYWYRKNHVDIRLRRIMREKFMKINDELRTAMQAELSRAKEIKKKRLEQEAKNLVLYIAFKFHHHLRTNCKEGVYSLHAQQELSRIEKLMKAIKFTSYMQDIHKTFYNTCWNNKHLFKVPLLQRKEQQLEHKKRFSFDTRTEDKYTTLLDNGQPITDPIREIERFTDWAKHIDSKDFDITARKAAKKLYPPPYFVDFWSRGCDIHDIEDDL